MDRAAPDAPAPAPERRGHAGSEARRQLLRLHEALYRKQKALVAGSVAAGPALRAYEARYQRRVRVFERAAAFDEVVAEAARARVVHVGDYHSLKQSQRWFLKLVRRLVEAGRPVVVALEFAEARRQAVVDRYLAGGLSERRLEEALCVPGRRDAALWPHFLPIFVYAREQGLPLVAIERAGGGALDVRDRFFARRIAATLKAHPDATVAVLAGQWHCAPPHLPASVARACPEPVRQLTVYQNAEPIWFGLERRGLEHEVEAVRVRDGEYCLVNTSPLVAQQSFLDWIEDGELVETVEPERRFAELAGVIARYLGLDAREALEHVRVHTAGDLSFLPRLRESGLFTSRELDRIRRQVLSRESYYVPRARLVYLAGLSLNHAAEEAAHFLRHVAAGDLERPREPADAFYARALEEAFAFFGSKLVNPRRKASHETELERQRRRGPPLERRIARAALAHRRFEADGSGAAFGAAIVAVAPELVDGLSHALGYMLGDRMYCALLGGALPKAEARRLFLEPMSADGDATRLYFELSRRFASVRLPDRA